MYIYGRIICCVYVHGVIWLLKVYILYIHLGIMTLFPQGEWSETQCLLDRRYFMQKHPGDKVSEHTLISRGRPSETYRTAGIRIPEQGGYRDHA